MAGRSASSYRRCASATVSPLPPDPRVVGLYITACPNVPVETWIRFAKLAKAPLFRHITSKGKDIGPDRLNDKEIARLVKSAALAAGVCGDLARANAGRNSRAHSLRAGLASSAEVDERYVEKQLAHASAEMTLYYQRRRDRLRVNLTKAVGM